MRVLTVLSASLVASTCILPALASTPSAGAFARLIESGRVPESRTVAVIEAIVDRGDEEDLAKALSLLDERLKSDAEKAAVLSALAEAARTRKIVPKGDLSALDSLLKSESESVRAAAVPLAGLWNVSSATEGLKQIVADSDASQKSRDAALDALMSLDRGAAADAVALMTAADQPATVRRRGVARLAELDTTAAAEIAAAMLPEFAADANPLPIVEPFLQQQSGPRTLARALRDTELSEDQAKNLLSRLSAIGSADSELTAAILKTAGLSGKGREWSPEKILEVAARIESDGDPAHGEEIFRREALNCFKCHQINKAGGNIGPELSAVGVTSPSDYLIKSLIYPSADIKEAWATRLVQTADGKILSGVVVSEDDDLLKLKDAQGNIIDIPVDDIDAEKEGDSLMPAGLTKFLTDEEFIDLVAYLKALGTPNTAYAVRQTPRLQRFEYLPQVNYNFETSVPGDNKLQSVRLKQKWEPIYARANGEVPLREVAARSNEKTIYLRGFVEVDEKTPVKLNLGGGRDGLVIWIGTKMLETTGQPAGELLPGRNDLMFRVDLTTRESDTLSVELVPDSGGSIRTVDGQ